jgi:hypothetical protein
MRHNYYKDYSRSFKQAKRIFAFLENIQQNPIAQFDFFLICTHLRWCPLQPVDKKDPLKPRGIRHDRANEIEFMLKLLKNIKAISDFNFQPVKEEFLPSNYQYQVTIINSMESWEELIKASQYFPLEGHKHTITNFFLDKKVKDYDISYYQNILEDSKKETYIHTALTFKEIALYEWEDAYQRMKGRAIDWLSVNSKGFEFFIDMGYLYLDENDKMIDCQNERATIFVGFSKQSANHRKRNISRLSGYRKRHIEEWADKETDTGHYVAHTIWDITDDVEVDLEFNLFPQKRALNQGHSEEGKLYRKMEQYCADNHGVFLFVRPIYGDSSDRPFIIEYGILKPDLTLWIEQFTNI